MAQSLASDSMHPGGKLPPTLTPTGHFAGKPTLPISRSVTLIGSRKQARLQLISNSVSQNHALIVNADSGPYVCDLASREHTHVNGIEVREGALSDGDEIQIGRFSFRFNASPQTQPIEQIRNIRPAPAARIDVDGGEMPLPVEGKTMLIGRRDRCDIPLLEEAVSTTHAIIFEMDGRRYIRDLGSRTGTFVNGKQVHQTELSPGDEIKIGDTVMRYHADAQPAAEPFTRMAPATDMGALEDDLVEPQTPEPAAPARSAPVRSARPMSPMSPASPAPAGTDDLELIQDQPDELEPADLMPIDLEADQPQADVTPADLGTDDLDIVDLEPQPLAADAEPVEVEAEAAPAQPADAETDDLEVLLEPQAADGETEDLEVLEPVELAAAAETDELEVLEPLEPHAEAPAAREPAPPPAAEREPEPQQSEEPFEPAMGDMLEVQDDLEPVAEDEDYLVDLDPLEPAARGADVPQQASRDHRGHAAPDDAADDATVELEPLPQDEAAAEQEIELEPLEAPVPQARTQPPAPRAPARHVDESLAELTPVSDEAPAEVEEVGAEAQAETEVEVEDEVELTPIESADEETEIELEPQPAAEHRPLAEQFANLRSTEAADALADAASAPAPAAEQGDRVELSAEEPLELEPTPVDSMSAVQAVDAEDDRVEVAGEAEPVGELEAVDEPPVAREPVAIERVAEVDAPDDSRYLAADDTAEVEAEEEQPVEFARQQEADVAPQPQPQRVTPAASVEQKVKQDVFRVPPEAAVQEDDADEAYEDDEESLAVAELDFASSPDRDEPELALSSYLEEMVSEPEPMPDIAGAAIEELPSFEVPEMEELDFTSGVEETLSAHAFAPIDESALDVPPLDLGEGIEPVQGLDEAAGNEALNLDAGTAEADAPAPAFEAPPEEPKKPRRRKKSAKQRAAEPTLAPEPTPAPAVAKAPPAVQRPRPERPAPEKSVVEAAPPPVAKAPPAIVPVPVEPEPARAPVAEVDAELHLEATPQALQPATAPLQLEPSASAPEPVREESLHLEPPPLPRQSVVEIIEPTQATPESALELDEAIDVDSAPAGSAGEAVQEVELTDTGFGRAVEEFSGPATGPLVEAPAPVEEMLPDELSAEELPVEELPAEELPAEELPAEELPAEELPAEEMPAEELPAAEISAEEQHAPTGAPVSDDDALELLAEEPATLEPVESIAEAEPTQEPQPVAEHDEPASLLPSERGPESPTDASAHERLFHLDEEPQAAQTDDLELALEPLEDATPRDDQSRRPTLQAMPVEAEPTEPESAQAEPVEVEAMDEAEEVELEPLELDPLEPPSAEREPAEAKTEPVEAAPDDGAAVELEPLEPEQEPAEVEAEFEFEPHVETPEPVAETSGPDTDESTDALGDWGLHLEPEPEPGSLEPAQRATAEPAHEAPIFEPLADETSPPPVAEEPVELEPVAEQEPVAEEPVPAAPVAEQPTPAPEIAPEPKLPPSPPRRPAPVEAFNWGANQEHFFGGTPLKLTPPRPAARPAPQQPSAIAPPAVELGADVAQRPATEQPAPRQQPTPRQQQAAPARPQAQPARPQASPFAGRDDKASSISTGFDGLIAPEGGSADVFAPSGLTAGFDASLVDDVFGGRRTMPTPRPATPAAAPGDGAKRPAARRATKAEPTGDAWTGAGLPETETQDRSAGAGARPPAGMPAPQAAPRKKRRWFGLRSLLLTMLLCMGAAGALIFYLVPNKSSVTGQLRFANFSALNQHARLQLAAEQQNLLADERIRANAKTKLSGPHPELSPGFLDNPVGYSRVVSTRDLNVEKGVLALTYVGGASQADEARMLALMQAIYDANRKSVDEANELNRTVESLARERADATRTIADLRAQIDQLTSAAEMPDVAERTRLEAEAAKLESAYNAAVATVTRLSSELKQLRENPNAVPAAAPAAPPTNDAVLAQLQAELQGLDERVGAIQGGRSEKAQAARDRLESALQSFNAQIEQAQGAVKNNPELLTYLTTAQNQMASTRELIDQLIRRQQDQYRELSELKSRLNEKMLARREEVWKKDPELVNLMDQRDIKTRQYNAAVGQGMTQEAADLKAQLDYLNSSILARQTLVADDSFYADAIDQLQKIIDATQRGVDADRQRTMQVLDEMQASLSRNQPALEKLTPEQQKLATEMEKRLADVGEARKQYTLAADTANRQAEEEIRTLQASASSLASKVQARKKELADGGAAAVAPAPVASATERERALAQKAAELASAEVNRAEAESAYFAANKRLLAIRSRIEDARAAGEKRDALVRQRDEAQKVFDQLVHTYDLKKKLAQAKAYPVAPTASDIRRDEKPDQRPVYTLAAVCGILAMFTCMMLLTRAGGRSEDPPPPPVYLEQPEVKHGNGFPVIAMDSPEEEEQPTPVEV